MLKHTGNSEERVLYEGQYIFPVRIKNFNFEEEDPYQPYFRNWDPEKSEWGSSISFGKIESFDNFPDYLPDGTKVEFDDEIKILCYDGILDKGETVLKIVGTATADLAFRELSEADRLTEDEARERIENAPRLLEESSSVGKSESKQPSC